MTYILLGTYPAVAGKMTQYKIHPVLQNCYFRINFAEVLYLVIFSAIVG